MNRRASGTRHENKIVAWLIKLGWTAAKARIPGGKFGKIDLFGADIVALMDGKVLAVQAKKNKGHIASGAREIAKYPWPLSCVICWPARAKSPLIRWVNGEIAL